MKFRLVVASSILIDVLLIFILEAYCGGIRDNMPIFLVISMISFVFMLIAVMFLVRKDEIKEDGNI